MSEPETGSIASLPLNALRAFDAASRHGSFRLAAQELHITPSAVSHQIAHLEERLGCALFSRVGGRASLSEEGRVLQPFIRDAFARMVEGIDRVGRSVRQELTVQVYITVAVRWLMPRLHHFQRQRPELLLKFNASHLSWDFEPAIADVGIISTAEPVKPGLHYTPLFEADLVLVCSPSLLAGAPPLTAPADIAGHQRLQVYTALEDWRTWSGAAGIPFAPGGASASFDSYLLVIEAACEGRGVAVVPHFLAAQDIRSGRLMQPFSVTARQPARWVLACRESLVADPAIVRFREWLQDEVMADPLLGPHAAVRGRGRRSAPAGQIMVASGA
jgi:LysR family transcriptional regulator, glycine cleavage system transcriptional activator